MTLNAARIAFWTTVVGLLGLAIVTLIMATAWLNRPFPGFFILKNGTVDSILPVQWTGTKAGLKVGDRVLSVDGTPLRSSRELYAHAASVPVGHVTELEVERMLGLGKMGTVRVPVPTQRFGWTDFVATGFSFWLLGIFHILIGAFVSIVKPADRAARAHLAFCLVFGAFCVTHFDGVSTYYFALVPHTLMYALIGAVSIHLAFLVPRAYPWFDEKPWIWRAQLGFGLAFALLLVANYFRMETWLPFFGFLNAYASIGVLAVPVAAVIAARSASSSGLIKRQAQFILWGALIGFLPAIIFNTAAMMGLGIPAGELTLVLMIVFPLTVAYTIVKHQLFDISIIVKRTITYAFVTSALLAGYFVLIAAARAIIGEQSQAANIVATAVVAVAFAPLRDRTKVAVDRIFFRSGYDFQRILTDFGDQARETFDPGQLICTFIQQIELALHPTYVAVLLRPEGEETLRLADSLGLAPGSRIELPLDHPSFSRKAPEPTSLGELQDALVFQLKVKEDLVGVVAIGPRKSDLPYKAEDLNLLDHLSQQLALWVKNAQLFGQLAGQERMRRELEIAHEVQSGLLPSKLPSAPGLELTATSIPALEVGGDFYDVFQVDEDRLGILIGDVSGKGVPAALLMAMTLVIFRSIARGNCSSAEVMAKANDLIFLNRPSSKMFVTAFYAVYDHRDRSLVYSNAGNPLPITSTGRLEAKGISLGILPNCSYEEKRSILAPGELVAFYSDGAEDAINSTQDQFGEERLLSLIAEVSESPVSTIQDRILDAVRDFSGGAPQFDDITLVVMRGN